MLLTNILSSDILLAKSEMNFRLKKSENISGGLYMWFYREDELDEYTEKDKDMADIALAYMWAFKL